MSREKRIKRWREIEVISHLAVRFFFLCAWASPIVFIGEAIYWLRTATWPCVAMIGLRIPATDWEGLNKAAAWLNATPISLALIAASIGLIWMSLACWNFAQSRLRAALAEPDNFTTRD